MSDNSLTKPVRTVAEGAISEPKQVSGTIDIPPATSLNYALNQVFDRHAPSGFHFEPDPPSGMLVQDIRVGKNSQVACTGSFKASILPLFSKYDILLSDLAHAGMQILLHLTTTASEGYQGRISIEVTQTEIGVRYAPLPFPITPHGLRGRNTTQVHGRLVNLLVSPQLSALLAEGRAVVTMTHAMLLQSHQDEPVMPPIPIQFHNDHFEVGENGAGVPIEVSQGVSCQIHGRDEKGNQSEVPPGISVLDLLPILRMISTADDV